MGDAAYVEALKLFDTDGLAVPLRRGSMSRAERLGAWMDRKLSIGSSCSSTSDDSFHSAMVEVGPAELEGNTSMYADVVGIDMEGECQVNLSELRRTTSHDSV